MSVRRHGYSPRILIRASQQYQEHGSYIWHGSSKPKARALNHILTWQRIRLTIPTRAYHATPRIWPNEGKDDKPIAVLGGGITGMATAYYLTKAFPGRSITLFESNDTLGGWMKTTTVDVGDGEVIFESGPRSLRPGGLGALTATLIQELDLIEDLLVTKKDEPAAQNRFIYYPDHLVLMPTKPWGIFKALWSEELFSKLLAAVWKDINAAPRSPHVKDESVGSFVSRRGHETVARNMLSAVFHGIYAGDIWRLSAKSIMSGFWMKEVKHENIMNSVLEQQVDKQAWHFCDDFILESQLRSYDWDPELSEKLKDCSVYTFKRGMYQLAEGLEERLLSNPNVKILKAAEVAMVSKDKGDSTDIQIEYRVGPSSTSTTESFSYLISTIRPDTLLALLGPAERTPTSTTKLETEFTFASRLTDGLANTPTVTVCVVNLYYPVPKLLQLLDPPGGLPAGLDEAGLRGFGYLLPESLPFQQNPELALGVIFDSDVSPALHSTVPEEKLGTRLTVMLGGHWWDEWQTYPTDAEAQVLARNTLARHLGITLAPSAVNVSLQKDCIPQYHVGHSERLSLAHEALWDAFGGGIRVAGSWFTGVGVNDCIRSAWDVVEGLKAEALPMKRFKRRTGLERFSEERGTVLVKKLKTGELEVVKVDARGVAFEEFFASLKEMKGIKGIEEAKENS